MELITISGFLGSGKTTLLLELAKELSQNQGRKVAIIENEAGQIGIDGELLKAEGLPVREIYSGCICCSLRTDLIQTLLDLEREVQPEIVLLEPSGVAGPKQIQRALSSYSGEIDSKTMVVLMDAARLPAIQDFSMPLINDGIEVADLVAINKADRVSEAELESLKERVLSANPSAELLPLSAQQGTNVDVLLKKIVARFSVREEGAQLADPATDAKLPHATIYADTISGAFDDQRTARAFLENAERRLHQIAQALRSVENAFIGHIKAIVKTQPTGYAVLSATDFDTPPVVKGRLPETAVEFTATLNAIVYGVEKEELEELCRLHVEQLRTECAS